MVFFAQNSSLRNEMVLVTTLVFFNSRCPHENFTRLYFSLISRIKTYIYSISVPGSNAMRSPLCALKNL
jgi:hypothetical protein